MTREEAIKILKAIRVYECYPKSASEETKEAIDIAIEALNSVTDSENGAVESKNDVIKRQDAIKTVIRMCSPICDWELEKKAYTDCVIDEINSLPSADRPTRLTNAEWKDFLSESFGISKSSAREMLHGMMSVKREDNFKKRFNQRRGERREADMLEEDGEEE